MILEHLPSVQVKALSTIWLENARHCMTKLWKRLPTCQDNSAVLQRTYFVSTLCAQCLCFELSSIHVWNTINSRIYLKFQGTVENSLRYPKFKLSEFFKFDIRCLFLWWFNFFQMHLNMYVSCRGFEKKHVFLCLNVKISNKKK